MSGDDLESKRDICTRPDGECHGRAAAHGVGENAGRTGEGKKFAWAGASCDLSPMSRVPSGTGNVSSGSGQGLLDSLQGFDDISVDNAFCATVDRRGRFVDDENFRSGPPGQ